MLKKAALVSGIIALLLMPATLHADDITQKVKNRVNRTIDYPQEAKALNLQGFVYVDYSVDCDGTLIINEIAGSHEIFIKHVAQQLEEFKINNLSGHHADKNITCKYLFK